MVISMTIAKELNRKLATQATDHLYLYFAKSLINLWKRETLIQPGKNATFSGTF
jgi:hypothetical protein